MADHVSTVQYPADIPATGTPRIRRHPGDPTPQAEMVSTGVAAEITGLDARTMERWVDAGKLAGGRPRDPDTGEPISGSWRWVDALDAVAVAIGSGRTHLIPRQWRYLVPLPFVPANGWPDDVTPG